ncbi:MAG: zinc-binding dehydrogenase, partial [Pseudolysinimonas sp.]
ADGQLSVEVAAEFPLAEVRAAYELLVGGHSGGKIVLVP